MLRPVPGTRFQRLGLVAGLVAFALVVSADTPLRHFGEYGARPALAAGVALLMAIWWLTSALPLHWTACVPLVVFPWTDVFAPAPAQNALRTALPYFDPYNFLFLGGLLIGAGMQQWNLHRRVALTIMLAVGTDPARVLFGFLLATAFISLWISNTATAAMMLPIGLAVIAQFESRAGRRLEHWGAAVMLAVAYGANVGGIGTKIGTAPNALFSGFMAQRGVAPCSEASAAMAATIAAGPVSVGMRSAWIPPVIRTVSRPAAAPPAMSWLSESPTATMSAAARPSSRRRQCS